MVVKNHLHSSSDVQEVVLRTISKAKSGKKVIISQDHFYAVTSRANVWPQDLPKGEPKLPICILSSESASFQTALASMPPTLNNLGKLSPFPGESVSLLVSGTMYVHT
jgi:hypothetical protein